VRISVRAIRSLRETSPFSSAANSAVMPEACFQHDRPRGAQFCAGHPLGHAPFLPDARKPRVSARIKRRDAGAVLGNRGAVSPAPGSLLRGLLGSRMVTCGSQDLTVRWLPSGTRVAAISVPGSRL
jgi:hypothetical protein